MLLYTNKSNQKEEKKQIKAYNILIHKINAFDIFIAFLVLIFSITICCTAESNCLNSVEA